MDNHYWTMSIPQNAFRVRAQHQAMKDGVANGMPRKILRLPIVLDRTGLSRSTLRAPRS